MTPASGSVARLWRQRELLHLPSSFRRTEEHSSQVLAELSVMAFPFARDGNTKTALTVYGADRKNQSYYLRGVDGISDLLRLFLIGVAHAVGHVFLEC
jgi:hypothetical protein